MFAERLGFLVFIGLLLAYAAAVSATFPDRARIFPLTVAAAGLLLVVLEAVRMMARRVSKPDVLPSALAELRAGAPYLAWFAGFYALTWVAGFLVASVAFVALFLTFVAGMRLWRALLVAGSVATVLLVLHWAFDVRWPTGLVGPW